jgi:DNA-binding protein HU-beta
MREGGPPGRWLARRLWLKMIVVGGFSCVAISFCRESLNVYACFSFNPRVQKGNPMAEMATSTAKAAPKAKVETISNRQIAIQMATKHGLTKKQANQIMEDLVTMVTKQLKKGTRIRLNGLGILQVRKRAARMGRNPATGEAIKIKASKKVAFRAAKELKKAI